MKYKCLNEVRRRMNKIGAELNIASNFGQKALPAELEDKNREWHELCDVYMKPALLVGGVEIREAE